MRILPAFPGKREEVMEYLGNLETYVELEVNGQEYYAKEN